jgi:hypothetical protein
MRKLALSTAAVAVAVGLTAAPSAADPPTHLFLEDDVTFQSGGLTAACGFPVFVSLEGGIHIMLRTDKNGVLHELDTFSDWSIAYTAPSQGMSFSFKFLANRDVANDDANRRARFVVLADRPNAAKSSPFP